MGLVARYCSERLVLKGDSWRGESLECEAIIERVYPSINKRCIRRAFSVGDMAWDWMASIRCLRALMPSSSGKEAWLSYATAGDDGDDAAVSDTTSLGGVANSSDITPPAARGSTCSGIVGVEIALLSSARSQPIVDRGLVEGLGRVRLEEGGLEPSLGRAMTGLPFESTSGSVAKPDENRRAWRRTGLMRNSETREGIGSHRPGFCVYSSLFQRS